METPTTQKEVVLATPPTPTWFYYLLGTLIFPIGIFLGVIYLRKDGYENRSFGSRSLLFGLLLPTMLIIIAVVSFVLLWN